MHIPKQQLITHHIIKLMKAEPQADDSLDEFEQFKQTEIMTYEYAQETSPVTAENKSRKVSKKIDEKTKLELLNLDKAGKEDKICMDYNKNKKKVQSNIGKIIPVGSAIFKSNFECGNIMNVDQVGANSYRIELEKEVNSNRQSSWFYFTVEGVKGEAHFAITGFSKSSSLFNEGMKICYKEVKDMGKWRRGGTKIVYTNSYQEEEEGKIYELRFSHFFKTNEYTCIEFAYCFPYGLKKLHSLIGNIRETASLDYLGKSYDGRDIPLLTLGNPQSKKVIVLSARVHPGETVSSFIMQGFLKELAGQSQFGKILRHNYLFKIVPMLNPDGVVRGNYRFSTSGYDLNRKWKAPKESHQPEIYHMKQLIRKMNKDKKVLMYIDMHGHSRQKNVFFYGCSQKGSNEEEAYTKPKEFPFLMEKIFDAYKYENCSFAIQKDKEGTARVAMWKELKIDYIYTLQSSFCGSEYSLHNYMENDYEKIGKKLCEGIATFFSAEMEIPKNIGITIKQLEKLAEIKKKAEEQLKENPFFMKVGDEEDVGSDSEPEKGEVLEKERNLQTGVPLANALHEAKKKEKTINSVRTFVKISSKNHQKFKSQAAIADESKTLGNDKNVNEEEVKFDHSLKLETNKIELKIAARGGMNRFELESLKTSSLYQKNARVHSMSKNNSRFGKPLTSPVDDEDELHLMFNERGEERQRVNLMHVREGAQYRRVRKLAQQNNRRETSEDQPSSNVVRGLLNNNIQIQKSSTIAPRFYPISQQKNRKTSVETYFRKQSRAAGFDGKKISINGDELNVRCLGNKIYF